MPILGLHFQSGVIVATSSIVKSYSNGAWQTPEQLTHDVYSVFTTHADQNLRQFVENIRMECSQGCHTPYTVARVVQRKMLEQGVAIYTQFILGGIDGAEPVLYSIVNGALLENKTYTMGEYEAECKSMLGYLDSKYASSMNRKDAINLVRNTCTLNTMDVVIDMMIMEIGKPVKKLSFFRDVAVKFNIGGSDV